MTDQNGPDLLGALGRAVDAARAARKDEIGDTPLDRIRAAERLIRERAEGAVPGLADWWVNGDARKWAEGVSGSRGFARHLATWHPAVALAVADMLHQAAVDIWAHGPLCICGTGCDACDDNLWEPHARAALAVADLVIRPDSERSER